MWRLGGECDKIGRRKFGVIERNDFEHGEYPKEVYVIIIHQEKFPEQFLVEKQGRKY